MLTSASVPPYCKQIIIQKAKIRSGRRFFGEAFVLALMAEEIKDGFYNSYKWLTAEKWLTGKGLRSDFEKLFYESLIRYIGTKHLKTLQNSAKRNTAKSGGGKPVASDLMLIGENGKLQFIEVKLPGDRIRPNQLIGLGILKTYEKLKTDVRIIYLFPEGKRRPTAKTYQVQIS